jgi:hypothetical protein
MNLRILLALTAVTLLAGCESVSSRMQERFTPVAPHTRMFPFARKVVYEAAQQAVKNTGLLLGRKSLAQGLVEGYAPIRTADNTHDASQTTIQVRLTETDSGDTQVDVVVSEHTEGSFPGGISEQPQREHSLYDLYFAALQQVLTEKAPLKTRTKS